MAEKSSTNQAKKTLLDMNASWPLLIVYLAYLVGIYFAQQSFASKLTGTFNSFAYVFLSLILGIIITFLVYNGCKILFARLAGYQVSYIKCLGIVGEKREGKLQFHFDILSILDVGLSFAPVDTKLNRKPLLTFVGGFVGEIVLLAIGLILFFLVGTTTVVGTAALCAVLYGFIIPLYEVMPFRQDYANDMYNIIMTRKAEDRQAYNIVRINELREFSGDDFIVPDFADYDSFYKVQTLPYLFLSQLYNNELEKAVETLAKMKYLDKDMPDDKKYFVEKENVYLRFLTGDLDGANRIFLNIKSDHRKQIRSPYYLSDYRVALIACAYIARDKELLDNIFKDYNKLIKKLPSSPRVEKEKTLFRQVYETIKKNDPNQYLPPLD